MKKDLEKKCGLFPNKYEVYRVGGTPHKHDMCEYFVLDWEHDKFTGHAILAYVNACEKEYPKLAEDLRVKVAIRDRAMRKKK